MTSATPLSHSYDRIASEYTARIADELAGKPLDRALLQAFAEQIGQTGRVADLGCGPGHVAALLASLGLIVEGVDLSQAMVEQACQRYPSINFQQGDLRVLARDDASLGGITAFYSIIHLQPEEIVPAFHEWWRVLRPGGRVLLAFHIGDTIVHLDQWWDYAVDLDFHFLQPDAIVNSLQQAHFSIEAVLRRAPYPGVEHASERAYILACKEQAAD